MQLVRLRAATTAANKPEPNGFISTASMHVQLTRSSRNHVRNVFYHINCYEQAMHVYRSERLETCFGDNERIENAVTVNRQQLLVRAAGHPATIKERILLA